MTDKDATTEPQLNLVSDSSPVEQSVETAPKNKGGRPRRTPDVGLWTVRGVDLETRTAIEKAAQRSSKTIGQYINEDLRHYAQEQLKKGDQPPMRQEDLRTELDDIKGMITQLAERIPVSEKRSLLQRLFGG